MNNYNIWQKTNCTLCTCKFMSFFPSIFFHTSLFFSSNFFYFSTQYTAPPVKILLGSTCRHNLVKLIFQVVMALCWIYSKKSHIYLLSSICHNTKVFRNTYCNFSGWWTQNYTQLLLIRKGLKLWIKLAKTSKKALSLQIEGITK